MPRRRTETWTKIGAIATITGVILGAVLATPVWTYLQEYVLSTPKVEVEYVSDVVVSWTGEYTPIWHTNFTIILFVSSIHDFKIQIQSVGFELDKSAEQYLVPEYVSSADAEIYRGFETHGSGSQRMNLSVPVLAYFWITAKSTVWETSFHIGVMSIRITVTDLHNNLTDSKPFDVHIWWKG